MISVLTGKVIAKGLDWLVIEPGGGGVGLRVSVTPSLLGELTTADAAVAITLHTTLIVREDSLTLFGFPSAAERDTFDVLLSVTGIGPRTALAALSVLSPGDLAAAVDSEDLPTLQRIPGIGKKSASRMALELAGKLAAEGDPVGAPAAKPAPHSAAAAEVAAALEQLGWTKQVAARTVDELADQQLDASDLLRAALQQLGSVRG